MDRFDLEQSILQMWSTSDDIQLVIEQIGENNLSNDQVLNLLIGIKAVHDLRCEKGMNTLEKIVADNSFNVSPKHQPSQDVFWGRFE